MPFLSPPNVFVNHGDGYGASVSLIDDFHTIKMLVVIYGSQIHRALDIEKYIRSMRSKVPFGSVLDQFPT
jgi:hypothetical protein